MTRGRRAHARTRARAQRACVGRRRSEVATGDPGRMDREVVAFHESGHAVLQVILGVPLRYVTIVPEDGSLGHTLAKGLTPSATQWLELGPSVWTPTPPSIRDRVERRIMSTLAGEIAQERATGTTEGSRFSTDHPVHGTVIIDGDWHVAVETAAAISVDNSEVDGYLEWLHARTRTFVNHREVWASVEAVAAALLSKKTLSSRRVRDITREVRPRRIKSDRAGACSDSRGQSTSSNRPTMSSKACSSMSSPMIRRSSRAALNSVSAETSEWRSISRSMMPVIAR